MLSEDEQLLSLYREIRCLHRGKNVYLIQHITTKQVFVKKILSVYDENLYLTLKSSHIPGTPKIFHVIRDGHKLIVIEEYIRGTALSDFISRRGPLDLDTALHITLKLCDILSSLHSLRPPVIHRDITPSNVLITSSLDVFLIDFNASRQYRRNRKRDTILMGTDKYAAPEQFGFCQSDARTDIYSLSVLLNVMLTGFPPGEFLYRGKISKVIERACSMEPGKRYPSVKVFKKLLLNPGYYMIPIGFRSRNPIRALAGAIGYIFLGWLCFSAGFEGIYRTGPLMLCRGFTFAAVLSCIALCSNFMRITERLPLARSEIKPLRIAGTLIWCFISFTGLFLILAVILSLIS